eukprot:3172403-Ditylum_brightwellii.AAC.1
MYSGADLAKELRDRRSTTSLEILTNDVAIHWGTSKQEGTIAVDYIRSDLMLTDPSINPHGDNTLNNKIDMLIGARLYSPPSSEHCTLLFKAQIERNHLQSDHTIH